MIYLIYTFEIRIGKRSIIKKSKRYQVHENWLRIIITFRFSKRHQDRIFFRVVDMNHH